MPLDLGFLKAAIDRSLAQAKNSEAQGDRAKAAQACNVGTYTLRLQAIVTK